MAICHCDHREAISFRVAIFTQWGSKIATPLSYNK